MNDSVTDNTKPYLSRRLPEDLSAELLAETEPPQGVLRLSESNPTRCGFIYPELPDAAFSVMRGPYEAEALGPMDSREAVARLLTRWGRATQASQVALTASTSEALSYLFKVALNPGDTVGMGVPGYPLVPHLAELEGVATRAFDYARQANGAWRLDLASVARVLETGAKALVLVSPANPTGATLSAEELIALARLSNAHQALVIIDEVFAPYHAVGPAIQCVELSAFDRVVSLGGLSKAALLPQAKVSWAAVHGSAPFRAAMMAGLEWVGDSFLSLGVAARELPLLLTVMDGMQAQARARVAENYRALHQLLHTEPGIGLDPLWAGWYAVVRVHPGSVAAAAAQLAHQHVSQQLLERALVDVHPGYLYDLPDEHVLVASLIVPPAVHLEGWARVVAQLRAPGA